jgi:hypothetical protein
MTADSLASSLRALAALVGDSGFLSQARWLLECAERLEGSDGAAAREAARDFTHRVAGMGSLSDLPLTPAHGLSKLEAERRYIEELDRADAIARDLLT